MTLIPNTLFVGKVCIKLESVASTQTYLKNLYAKSKPIEGTAILSYNQTAGYGQRDAFWEAENGSNIALSIVLYPDFLSSNKNFYLSMVIALAVKKAVEEICSHESFIKWPNDIMLNGMKLAGILIETSVQNYSIEKAFIGIGLNVNQEQFGELSTKATSIKLITGFDHDLDTKSKLLLEWIERYYLQLKSSKFGNILSEYNNALYKKGELIQIKDQDNNIFIAKLISIDSSGKIVLEQEGFSKCFLHGEVRMLY